MPKSEYLKFGGYLEPRFRPGWERFIICTFRLEPAKGAKFAEAAVAVAAESSIGTWTELITLTQKMKDNLAAKVFYLDPKSKIIKIAYPLRLFELGNLPQFLSGCAGNIFSMKIVDHLRLEDVYFPKKYVNSFLGPRFGIPGIRKILKIYNRPLVGAIVKPKLGLSAAGHAMCAYDCFRGGVDLVKDDENLTDQDFNHFTKRVKLTLALAKKAEIKTGEKKVCAFNVTAPTSEMIKRAKYIKKMGGTCAMIDIVSTGFSSIQELRAQNLGLIIHGHRAGHSTFTRSKNQGIAMSVIAHLSRLAGIDQLHTGTVVGKMEGEKSEVTDIDNLLKEDWGHFHSLKEDLSKIKPVMPIASGGLHPALTPRLMKILGKDLIINFGGGIHGHPDGTYAGAKAARASVEAAMSHIPLEKFAETRPELKVALDYWKNKSNL
ncbi:MAG: type III ribulose-bisphosphate carboxylase [Patescibacteria group bacterium]|nr:type III ribulose-bisphosphate carboxylase [Patescibacteria group bacterium]MDD5121536.1 type III ribulose-bisphosphate carboxylase [Patescibacteria group bacterium]MDD5222102.1 type III ribulose-bisphosphate carboxylase [Patescibacteria group bacterium]MDD5396300.1 type III ribulose-bisphosphate carboxylase [Patescibacteria group bacterium]